MDTAAVQEPFVGRESVRAAFAASLHALGSPTPGQLRLFLINGAHGMGKSALLRHMARLAEREGQRQHTVDLAPGDYLSPRDLAERLAAELRPLDPTAMQVFDDTVSRRAQLAEQHRQIAAQWARWQAISSGNTQAASALLDEHFYANGSQIERRSIFGGSLAPSFLANQIERSADMLGWILAFRQDNQQRNPASPGELLAYALGDEAALFTSDAPYAKALAEATNALASRQPLVLLIDSYDVADSHDAWMRDWLCQLGPTVVVAVAGRNWLVPAYQQHFSGQDASLLHTADLNEPLALEHEAAYLSQRLGVDLPSRHMEEQVGTTSKGLPLALVALGDQLASSAPLTPYEGIPGDANDPEGYLHALVERFLLQVLGTPQGGTGQPQARLRDRQRIWLMAILPADAELIAAAWGVAADEAHSTAQALAESYSFLFHGCALFDMHPLARSATRANARVSRTRTEWQVIVAGLQRALEIVQQRQSRIETTLDSTDAHYAHPAWRAATITSIELLLWLGKQEEAHSLLLNRWLISRCVSPAFARHLFEQAAALAPNRPGWKKLLAAMRSDDYQLLDAFSSKLEPAAQAAFGMLRADHLAVESPTSSTSEHANRAIELLASAFASASTWPELRATYAEAIEARANERMYRQGDTAAAISDLHLLHELAPENAAALRQLGDVYAAQAQGETAIQSYSQSLAISDSAAARLGRASALAQRADMRSWQGNEQAAQQDRTQALDDLNHALASHRNDPVALALRGRLHRQLGDPTAAVADLLGALGSDPLRGSTHGQLALAWADLAERDPVFWQRATNAAELAEQFAGADADALLDASMVALRAGDSEAAQQRLATAIAARPQHVPTLYALGRAQIRGGAYAEALHTLDTAIKTAPEYPALHRSRAEAALRMAATLRGEERTAALNSAMRDATTALQAQPGNAESAYWLARSYTALGATAEASDAIDQAIAANPDTPDFYVVRGNVRQQQAEQAQTSAEREQLLQEAQNDLDLAIPGASDLAEAYVTRGQIRLALGEHEEAVEDFDEALLKHQNDPTLLYWRGKARMLNPSMLDEAEQNFRDAWTLDPDQIDARFQHGSLMLQQNQLEEAQEDFEAVLARDPDNLEAQRKLATARFRAGKYSAAATPFLAQLPRQIESSLRFRRPRK